MALQQPNIKADTHEELRIIAKDGRGLSTYDRAMIAIAADELDLVYAELRRYQGLYIDANKQREALADRLRDLSAWPQPIYPHATWAHAPQGGRVFR